MADPRITEETIRALSAIAYFGEATAVQIRARSGLASGTLSPILARLEGAGWVVSRQESREAKPAGKPGRRFYRIDNEAVVRHVAQTLKRVIEDLLEAVG